jgi:hypothetical protein
MCLMLRQLARLIRREANENEVKIDWLTQTFKSWSISFNDKQAQQFELMLVVLDEVRSHGVKFATLEERLMALFSEYKTAVDESLAEVLTVLDSEKIEILAAIEAAKNSDSPAIDAALAELAIKRASIRDAIAGVITTATSPVEPTPVEPTPEEPLPVIEPIVVEPTPAPAVDPEVPVVIEPSPVDVGVDGGANISPTE